MPACESVPEGETIIVTKPQPASQAQPTLFTRPIRRLLVGLMIPVYLTTYVVVLIGLASRLPAVPWVAALYFALGGTLWGVPLLPLISWSEGVPFLKRGQDIKPSVRSSGRSQ